MVGVHAETKDLYTEDKNNAQNELIILTGCVHHVWIALVLSLLSKCSSFFHHKRVLFCDRSVSSSGTRTRGWPRSRFSFVPGPLIPSVRLALAENVGLFENFVFFLPKAVKFVNARAG